MKRLVLLFVVVIGVPAAHAQVAAPTPLTGTLTTIAAGPGTQTDPHISGSRVSFTNRTTTGSNVSVFDLASGVASAIDNQGIEVFQDSISDISGDTVVFTRRLTATSIQEIAFADLSDPSNPLSTVTVLAPDASARRTFARVGGDTVAFQQFTTPSTAASAICVASLLHPSDPAHCLTNEALSNSDPDVSPDGNIVVFQSCQTPHTGCDIYSARRNLDGIWGTPVAITSAGGNDLGPKTNGTTVVYASNAGGDFDIYYEPVTGAGTATRLQFSDVAGSNETAPSISGTLISMERTLPGQTSADVYLFDIATNTLFQWPATPDIDEHLVDVAEAADGTVRVVWAHVDPLHPDEGDNVYAMSVNFNAPSYVVCPLFDTSRSFKSGRVVPLKIQLCDATGSNLSDLSLVLTATGLAQLDGSASTLIDAESAGQANADGVFRYDASLGGYIFNLSTAGLATGTWELRFRVSGDNAVYRVTFDIR